MTCTVEGCARPYLASGYCSMHWQRVKTWGEPGLPETLRPRGPVANRIAGKFIRGEGCWEWTAAKNAKGYGFINLGGRPRLAHRVVYEELVGLIPAGLELDHLCRNPGCVRPDHLEPVTHRENMLRGSWRSATHCKNGHEWNEESTYWRTDGTYPKRQCRLCARERDRRRKK